MERGGREGEGLGEASPQYFGLELARGVTQPSGAPVTRRSSHPIVTPLELAVDPATGRVRTED